MLKTISRFLTFKGPHAALLLLSLDLFCMFKEDVISLTFTQENQVFIIGHVYLGCRTGPGC